VTLTLFHLLTTDTHNSHIKNTITNCHDKKKNSTEQCRTWSAVSQSL